MDMASGVRKFHIRCVSMNLSKRTMDTYSFQIKRFVLFLDRKYGKMDLEDISPECIRGFIADQYNKGYSPTTVHGTYRCINTFFRFLYGDGYIPRNPMENIPKPKVPKKHARTFNTEEIKKILSCFRLDSFCGIRNYTIVNLLFGTGMRRMEMLNLTLSDVDLTESKICVMGKGNIERNISITQTLRTILRRYIKAREEHLKHIGETNEYLLVTKEGRHMSQWTLKELFKKIKEDTGIKGNRVSPHTWRHTFAKTFLLNGGNLFALQKILGHSDITTTQIYVEYTDKELPAQMGRYSPLESKRWAWD